MSRLSAEAVLVDALQNVADSVVDLVGYDVAAIGIAMDADTIEVLAAAGPDEAREHLLGQRIGVQHVEAQLADSEDHAGICFLERGRPRLGAPGAVPDDVRDEADPGAWHPHDLLVAPVRDDRRRLRGVLYVDRPRDGRRPTEQSLSRLRPFAAQARRAVMMAIEKAELAEQVRLADAARLIVRQASSEFSVDRIIAVSQPALVAGFDAFGIWVHAFDEVSGDTDVVHGAVQREIRVPQEFKLLSHAYAQQLWEAQQVGVIDGQISPPIEGLLPEQARRIQHFMARMLETSSMLVVPIGAGHECLGTLVLTRRHETRPWTEFEKRAALDIGHDLGRALLNARIFEHERRLVAELSELDGYKTRLVATISHELKNPLTAVMGHVELLESAPQLDDRMRTSIAAMERGALRMQRTIDDLLVLARQGAGHGLREPTLVDLVEVVAEELDGLRAQAATKELKVAFEPTTDPLLVTGDPAALHLLCGHLLSNAVKFTPAGGAVAIGLADTGAEVELTVSDTGIGISAADLPHLFEEFFRSNNPVAVAEPGTGLGLTIAQRIAERHRGRIEAGSEPAVGSTFTLVLPKEQPTGEQAS